MKEVEQLERLARQASQGDEDSFVAFCNLMQTRLYRAAVGILGDEALALDAVSEAVYRAFKSIKRLREPKYAATWFTRLLINAANDIYKRRKHERTVELMPEGAYPDDYSDMSFFNLIESLPLELREIISLKYYSGFTLAEIALTLEVPEGTVKSRLNRALRQLRLEVDYEQ